MDHDEVDQDNHHVSADTSVRFGKLNLIICVGDDQIDVWRRAKKRCIAEAPITRDRAIEIHNEERAKK